jgi:pyrroline-5-carboxylate reductase
MAQSYERAAEDALGIIGVGGLAGFVVEGLRRAGDEREILLSPRSAAQAAHLAKRFGCRVAADNQAVLDGAGLVILSTPPAAVLPCVSALSWREGQAMICVAIDVTRATLAEAAPGALVLRAMPSNAAALGICPTPLFPAHAEAKALLSRLGPVFELEDERAFDAATALAGYHLWCYGLMEAVAQAAVAEGLPRTASAGIVAGLTRAAGEFALRMPPEEPLREPLDRHGMPGTMTAQGLAVLDRLKAFEAWQQAYGRAIARLKGETPTAGERPSGPNSP